MKLDAHTHRCLACAGRARPGDGASSSSSYHDPRNKLQHVKTFLAQKTYRARRSLLMDKFGLWALTSASLLLSWLIGYLRVSWLVLVVLLALMVVLWREQSQRLVRAVEQEAELKMRKRRAVHHSETAEWVNVALNRWWAAAPVRVSACPALLQVDDVQRVRTGLPEGLH